MKHGLCLIPDHIHSDLAELLIEGRINLIKATKQKKRNFAADNLVFVMNYVPGLFYRPASIVILTGGTARRRFQHGDLATDLPMKQKAKNIADIQLPSDDEPSQSASQESSVFLFQSVTGYVTRPQRNHQQSTWMRNYVGMVDCGTNFHGPILLVVELAISLDLQFVVLLVFLI
ncbi:hypothetical protein T06_2953 [Trichinella sp. T6]|nr:hypothetical protein T06_2953 [Trichinella sp. T6]